MLLISQANPAGHVVIARIAEGSRVVVTYAGGGDGGSDVSQDVTEWLPDLFLIGLAAEFETAQAQLSPPPEKEEIARVHLVGPEDGFLLLYGHPATGQVQEVRWPQAVAYVAAGITSQITAGVAAEAAEESMPDDASQLEV